MSMALIGVLGLLIIAVTGLAIMVVKLSFTKRVPLRRQRQSEKSTTKQKSQQNTQPSIPLTTSAPETREPVMSALYAEAETPLTRNTHTTVTDDASQHYAEAGSTDHYSETQAFSVVDEPKPQVGVKRGGKYGYSTVNKTKKKNTEQTNKSSTLPRHLPNDNVYMPLTEGEYDHLNSPRPKNKNPIGLRLLPYQEVSLRKKKLNKDQKGPEVPYDVPPSHKKMDPQETYDVPKSQSQIAAAQETYDVPPSHDQTDGAQETYDVPGSNVPLNDYDAPRAASQGTYDVPPPSSQRAFPGQATYDRPPLIPSAVQSVYDVPKSQKDKTASPKSSPKL
ncbi:uncharacterized protein LOC133177296 [Saccostrea echinata]|uniref:uncharacterized protein LOC133177296 n=1 Tax=Saccostrea echinata TaxID=191078 RepID=UPI002A817C77|nr:uncharacterized protein LOC133177296 [Saccostrea echinata]